MWKFRPDPSEIYALLKKTIPQFQRMLEFCVLEINGLGETSAPDQDAAPRQHAAIRVLEQNHPEKGGPQYAALRPASRLRGIEVAAVARR